MKIHTYVVKEKSCELKRDIYMYIFRSQDIGLIS